MSGARKSTTQGLGEAPQAPYRGAAPLGDLDPDLAKALGLDDEDGTLAPTQSDAGEPTPRGSRDAALRDSIANPKGPKTEAELAAEARESARKAREIVRERKGALAGHGLPGKNSR